jgi:MraZ protein
VEKIGQKWPIMGENMLRGHHPARIDDKGRLKIPAAFLGELAESSRDFFVTSIKGDFVRIYPMPAWLEIEKRLAAMPQAHPARQRFLERVNFFGQVAQVDSQGRILIPQILRKMASMEGDVAVLGQQNHVAVWNSKRLEEKLFDQEPFSEDDAKQLAEFGI